VSITEALRQRLPRVRAPEWHPGAYVRVPLLPDGRLGPWLELYDAPAQHACGVRPGSQRVLWTQWGTQSVEPYTGPPSEWEQDPANLARWYAES
jgi:hypothetical protein